MIYADLLKPGGFHLAVFFLLVNINRWFEIERDLCCPVVEHDPEDWFLTKFTGCSSWHYFFLSSFSCTEKYNLRNLGALPMPSRTLRLA